MINEKSKSNYPSSWEVVKLGDFADSEKGKKPKNQQPLQDEKFNLPYIDIEAFEKGIFKSFTDGEKCVICDDSDFLMVWDGSRSGLVGKGLKGALGSTLVRINLPMINNLYGYYYLQSKYLEINTRAKGVGIPHVDPSLLWSYDFPIPPVNEQNRIVDKIETLFSEVDAGIANLTLAKRQLEQYRQSLLKHAFEGKLTAKWREEYAENHGKSLPNADELLEQIQTARRDYHDQQMADWEQAVEAWEEQGKEGTKPRKPSKLSEIEMFESEGMPQNWIKICAESTCDFITKGTTPSKEKLYQSQGEIPFIKVYNLTKKGVSQTLCNCL
ncbi:restriction endonuclease subunit S [Psychrobacter immobilis]|uniref:restriction endonuclease subunit S n=1 Tax=Psychrobacter immobilis TaxID=498 RepID=UPI001919A3B8|nr:restriction endonuclease subunit S [Psychrobacter immobilis]